MDKLVKYYKHYIDRNNSYEEFAYDVNTLGGTFGDLKDNKYIETKKGFAIVKDGDWNVIYKVSLRKIWEAGTTKQLQLL